MNGGDGRGRRPAVSVVIPTRDRWELLSETLSSVLAQVGTEMEVLLVDDGSTSAPPHDGPFADPRVRLLRNESALGVAGARNRGIGEAVGEWVAFLDDDDVWAPDKLRLQLDAARAADASFAYAGVVLVTAGSGRSTIAPAPPADRLGELLTAYNAVPAGASNMIASAELLRAVGGFDPEFMHLADWDLWVRLAAEARGAACPEPLVGYRLHPASMRSTSGGAIAELTRFDRKHSERAAVGGPGRPPDGRIWFYRWLSDGQLLAGRRVGAAVTSLRGAARCRSVSDAQRALRILLLGGGSSIPADLPAALTQAPWLQPLLPAPSDRTAASGPGPALKRRLRLGGAAALDRALRLTGSEIGLALVYHGLRDDSEVPGPVDVAGSTAAATFREQLASVGRTYRLVHASDLREAARSRRRGDRFPLAITFDDDLRSHVDVALPILRENGAVATFFLTGASLTGPASFWWERVERSLATGSGTELLEPGDPDQAVATVAELPREERRVLSDALLERLGGELEGTGLRAEHVTELAAEHEIGFHTREHERLPTLDDDDLTLALCEGTDALEQAAGAPLRSVAYPHGDADERVAAAARNAGFESGWTTAGAAVRPDSDPYLMARLYPSAASSAHLASQLSLAVWRATRGG